MTQARDELADLVNRVAYGSERIVLTRHGKPVAALVSREDLAVLEQHDLAMHDRAQQPIRLGRTEAETGAGPGPQPVNPAEPLRIAAEHSPGRPEGPGVSPRA